ncbi:MAG TPA: IS701 family transposase [Pseudonocardiaceae bacterium]|nr:IS701 family transposase [Pseudonocardiaceae bacterium]
MKAAQVGSDLPVLGNVDDLSSFCQEIFSCIPRSDQRRWAEVYIRGLISVPGRKSIRRISDYVVGWRADQCLQQFVNQSPWKWEPMRRNLAQQLTASIRPRVWSVEEVVFPKNGERSVGVTRQYSAAWQRMLNCQLGLAVVLADEDASCPVNWRLQLPSCWDGDQIRRSRAHVPTDVRHRQRWECVLEALDVVLGWGVPPAPVVVDATQDLQVEPLLLGLEDRGLRYLVRVGERTPALQGPTRRMHDGQRVPSTGEVAASPAKPGQMTVTWRDRVDGRTTTSRFSTVTIPTGQRDVPIRIGPGHRYRPLRSVLTEWPVGRSTPASLWVHNLGTARLPELINLLKVRTRAGAELAGLSEELGLHSFEGRSFRGWHHHVTLVSAAHLYGTLRRLDMQPGDVAAIDARPRA